MIIAPWDPHAASNAKTAWITWDFPAPPRTGDANEKPHKTKRQGKRKREEVNKAKTKTLAKEEDVVVGDAAVVGDVTVGGEATAMNE